MTTNEMHIKVNQGAQGLGPSRFDDFLPEEIDAALNESQSRKVKSIFNIPSQTKPLGFEQSVLRTDELDSLVKTAELPTFKTNIGYAQSNMFDTVAVEAPKDYMFGTESVVAYVHHNNCQVVTKTEVNNSYKYYAFQIPVLSNYDNYKMYSKQGSNVADILVREVPTGLSGTYGRDQLIYWLSLNGQALSNEYDVYYETFKDLTIPGHVIVVYSGSTVEGLSWSDTLPNVGEIDDFSTHNSSRKAQQISNPVIRTSRLRYSQQQDINILLEDPFNTTSIEDPLYERGNRMLMIYESAIFIVPTVFLTYVKLPRRISLSLGLECELPEQLHEEIVQGAVQILLGDTGNPRVQQAERDIQREE